MCILSQKLSLTKGLKKLGASVASIARKRLGCLNVIRRRSRRDHHRSAEEDSSRAVAHQEVRHCKDEDRNRPTNTVIEAYRAAGSYSITTDIDQPPEPLVPFLNLSAPFTVGISFVNKCGGLSREFLLPAYFRVAMREFLTPTAALYSMTRIFRRCCPSQGQFSFWIIPPELIERAAETINLVINRPAGFLRHQTSSMALQFLVEVTFEVIPTPSVRPKEASTTRDDLLRTERRSTRESNIDSHATNLSTLHTISRRRSNIQEIYHRLSCFPLRLERFTTSPYFFLKTFYIFALLLSFFIFMHRYHFFPRTNI